MDFLGILWEEGVMRPIINMLTLFYDGLFDNFVLAILAFTIFIRVILLPLTLRQTRQMKRMQSIQPKIRAAQEKYRNKNHPDARKQLSQETMRVYREAGVSPVGCLGPLVIQMPIWIGLYRALLRVVPTTPEGLVNLSNTFYFWNPSASQAPFNPYFLGVDLAAFTQAAIFPFNFALPVLVGISTWLQQKVSSPISTDPRQQQSNQILLLMLPAMLAVFSWNFPAGLGIYIFLSNTVGVVIQYFVGGQQPIIVLGRTFLGTAKTRAQAIESLREQAEARARGREQAQSSAPANVTEQEGQNDTTQVQRKNRRRGNRNRASGTERRSRRR